MEMESLNLMKGYGKVQEDDQTTTTQHPKRPVVSQRLKVILVVSSILLLALLGALALAALDHESSESPHDHEDPLNSAESIRAICNVTQYPVTCLSSISPSSLNSSSRTDPESVLKLSLQVSIKKVNNLTAFFDTLLAENGSSGALKDCLELCGEAKGKVQDSLTEMEVVGPGEKVLTPRKVNDIKTWMSAALTDQETCLDGLLETVGGGGDEGVNFFSVKSKVEDYKEVLSNSLAIVAHMDELLEKFGLTMY